VDALPLDPSSAAKIASLGVGRLGPAPEFLLNIVTGQPAGAAIAWESVNPESDGGNYPITPSTVVSIYEFGGNPAVSAYTAFTTDGHILIANTTTGMLYETFALGNNVPPYQISNGAIWDMNSYCLRSALKLSQDSSGLTSATAGGLPIWPLVLTHDEIFGVGGSAANPAANIPPILHACRISLDKPHGGGGYQWPATHQSGGSGIIRQGTCFRLSKSFVPPPNSPAYFLNLLTAFSNYGMIFDDFGSLGLISTDASQANGDPNSTTSDNYILAGLMHQIPLSALEIVENQARIINVLSGQVNQSPKWR
jgi:hypothetical protein